jgi:predicted DNA-binding protein (UPF0251 family)
VGAEPDTGYFKPQGVPLRELQSVVLSVEELEAIRLVDEEGLYQEAAAERMEVSRQTFQRVLRESRKKIADALVNGKALGIEGGDYVVAGGERIFECTACGHTWEEPFGSGKRARESACPECGGPVVRSGEGGFGARRGGGPRGRCGPSGGAGKNRERNGGRGE